MTSPQPENDSATTENATTEERPARPWWIGAAVVTFAAVVVLRGLNQAGQLTDGPLHLWYVQAGVCALAVAGYALLDRLIRLVHN